MALRSRMRCLSSMSSISRPLMAARTVMPKSTAHRLFSSSSPSEPIELSRYTLPAIAYTSPSIFEAEKRAIFKKNWILIARESQLQNPGDYVSVNIAGFPLFVIRDRCTALKGFHNVCRHRAGPIVTKPEGNTPVLRCAYHGWVYDSSGCLKKCSGCEMSSEEMSQMSLFPIRIQSWRGLVFANMDMNSSSSLIDSLGDLPEKAASFPIESFTFQREVLHTTNVNWKVYTENYQEGYHIQPVHPRLAKSMNMPQYKVENFDNGTFCIHSCPEKQGAETSGLWAWKWPNFALNLYDWGMNIERIYPISHDKTLLVYNFYSAPGHEAAINDFVEFSRQVTQEDFDICDAVWKNLNTGLYTRGVLSSKHENGVAFFQALVRKSLKKNAEEEALKQI